MNSGVDDARLNKKSCVSKSEEFSPPESKRLRLDDGCNNNLNNTINESQNNTRWSYSGDVSLLESEALKDMGVSMLEEEIMSCESTKKLSSEECLPVNLDNKQRLLVNRVDSFEYEQEISTSSSSEINTERIQQDLYDSDDLTIFSNVENESDYSSKIEIEQFGGLRDFIKEKMDCSFSKRVQESLEQYNLSKRRKDFLFEGEDKFTKLSDEIILMILKWLPKKCLVRCMLVCKRWNQIARDEVLWTRLDLGNKVLGEGTLGHVLPRGVQILRLAQAEIADRVFCDGSEVFSDLYVSKLQFLDLSMAVISPYGLAALLSKCKYLKKLSLEKCVINKNCCIAISQNTELEILNLTMCENIDATCIANIMKLKSLTALNVGWCSLDNACTTLLCKTLPTTVTRLNIAGCRKTMTDDNVKHLSKRCPNLIELDLSDCAILTMNVVPYLLTFTKMEHLSLSRCYSIPQAGYLRLAHMTSLLYLDVFGLMSESLLKALQSTRREPELNKFLYSSIARPTVGIRRTSIWGIRVRD